MRAKDLRRFLIMELAIRNRWVGPRSRATAGLSALKAEAGVRDDKFSWREQREFRFGFENAPDFLSIRTGRFAEAVELTGDSNRQHCRLEFAGERGLACRPWVPLAAFRIVQNPKRSIPHVYSIVKEIRSRA
jgi:hypothetical protein